MAKVKVRRDRQGRLRYTGLYRGPDGREHSAGTFGDRRAARRAAHEKEIEIRSHQWTDPTAGRRRLDDYVTKQWLPSLSHLEITTKVGYEGAYRLHVKPTFGSCPIGSIVPSQIGAWLGELDRKGLSADTQRHAKTVFNMILKHAKADGLISHVATQDVKSRRVVPKPVTIFTRTQWDKFISAIDPFWGDLCRVGVSTGMRSSELRALSPSQVDWANNRIYVSATKTPVSRKNNDGNRYVDKPYPKSGRLRILDVTDDVLEILAAHTQRRGLSADSTDPIFVGKTGKVFDQADLRLAFRAACEGAGIPPRRPHHMRSTRASWLLKDTRDLMYVKEQMGHADITTTQRYLTVVDETEYDRNEALAAFMARRKAAS